MKLYLLVLFALLAIFLNQATFSSDFIRGTGRFYAQDEDSLSLVKKQLLSSAFRDVISKELKTLSLDNDLFWERFENRFEAYFAPIQAKLKKEYGISDFSDKSVVDSKKMVAFQKSLRLKRLTLKSKFGRLSRVITSYSIKKMTRSTQFPNSRHISLLAKVNRKLLTSIYYKFTRENEILHFQHLYLTVSYELKKMNWEDVGVDVESDFTEVVKEHWKRWFQDNLNEYFNSVIVTDQDLKNRLREHLKLPQDTSHNILLSSLNEKKEEDDSLPAGISEYYDSLWMKIRVKLEKGQDDQLLKFRSFTFNGEFLLFDLNNNSLIGHYDFVKGTSRYSYEDLHKLSSAVASQVYRLPLLEFTKLKQKLRSLSKSNKKVKLEVTNIRTIQDLLDFNKLLTSRGDKYQLVSSIKEYSGNKGTISLSFRGGLKEFAQFLVSLKNFSFGRDKIIDFHSKEKGFSIILREKQNKSIDTVNKL